MLREIFGGKAAVKNTNQNKMPFGHKEPARRPALPAVLFFNALLQNSETLFFRYVKKRIRKSVYGTH